jgi:KDO2-lipid IV(A) lauroyltransferase
MNYLVYHLLLLPLSRLPHRVLYAISDFLYLVMYRLFKYRVKVVSGNIRNSFPEKTAAEHRRIERSFYRHFFDLIMEAIKQFTISREAVLKRCRVENPEALDEYAAKGKSVFILAGHYGNWELAAIACELKTLHQVSGIYHPLKSPFWDRKLQESRGRLGMGLVSKRALDGYFERTAQEPTSTLFATDQSPSNPYKAYWTNFLHQDTPIHYGAEKYAKQYDRPVFWGGVKKLKRGYYSIRFDLITDEPRKMDYELILEVHV